MVTYPMGRPSASAKKFRYSKRRNAYVKKGSKKPSRLRVSKTRYSVAKEVSRQLANYSENKFQGFSGGCLPPVPKPTGTQPLTYCFLNAGESIAGILPEFTAGQAMKLFNFPKGDDNDQRDGSYMYIRQSYLKMEVQMLPVFSETTPQAYNATTDFRLMIVKANRKYNKYGKFPDPGQKLFLNTQNEPFGYDGTTATPFLYMNQPINKRDFLVYCDKRFTLSPPSAVITDAQFQDNTSLQNPHYPIKKRLNIKLPVWKKTHFDDSTNNPDNLDTQWMIIVQAVPSAYCDAIDTEPNRNWAFSCYGTTTARDS